MASEYDKGWLSGIIDGEGCIGLYKQKRKGKFSSWTTKLQIANDNMEVIQKAKAIIGCGSIQVNGVGHYLLVVSINDQSILKELILTGKEEQRKLIFEALEHRRGKDDAALERLWLRFHSLNH